MFVEGGGLFRVHFTESLHMSVYIRVYGGALGVMELGRGCPLLASSWGSLGHLLQETPVHFCKGGAETAEQHRPG